MVVLGFALFAVLVVAWLMAPSGEPELAPEAIGVVGLTGVEAAA